MGTLNALLDLAMIKYIRSAKELARIHSTEDTYANVSVTYPCRKCLGVAHQGMMTSLKGGLTRSDRDRWERYAMELFALAYRHSTAQCKNPVELRGG